MAVQHTVRECDRSLRNLIILLPFILVAVSRSMKISLHVQLNAMRSAHFN